MTTTERPVVRVSGPADLAQAIPYLLGFHPSRSLVLVGLAAKQVVVTARLDVSDVSDVGDAVDAGSDPDSGRGVAGDGERHDDVLGTTIASIVRGGAERLLAVIFDDSTEPADPAADGLPWAGVAAAVRAAAERAGLEPGDTALASRGRVWSYDCTDPDCCPREGIPLDGTSAAVAAATFAGLVALPDRESVAALLDPVGEPGHLGPALLAKEAEAVTATLRGAGARWNRSAVRALFSAAREFGEAGHPGALDEARLVRFGAALQSVAVRDSVWLAVDDERIDGRTLWRTLGTRLPSPYDTPALFLFGWASYRRGDGALAGMAAQRAIDSDPDYTAADLLTSALAQAIDPRRLPRLRSGSPATVRGARPAERRGGGGRSRR